MRGSKIAHMEEPKDRWSVRERVLVHLAELLGPALDVVDVTDVAGLRVRDVLVHFRDSSPPASPAAVRAALHDLYDAGLVVPCGLDTSGNFMDVTSELRLTCRGLVAARVLDAGVGLPRKVLTFCTRQGKPMLDARFDTGDERQDALLNASGTVLAAAFIVLVEKPTRDKPLLVENCGPYFERLTMFGVRNRPGPRSEQVASEDAMRDAFDSLGKLLNLKRGCIDEDRRRVCYYLSGPLPEIRVVVGDSRHYGDWPSYSYMLWHIMQGEWQKGPAGQPAGTQSIGGVPDSMDHLFPPAANVGQRNDSKQRGRRRVVKDAGLLQQLRETKPKVKDVASGSGD